MSKVKKEPGYAGLILIYGLILILRMLHIASLDKLFNKKYRFYFVLYIFFPIYACTGSWTGRTGFT